jgi:hypothetical protein
MKKFCIIALTKEVVIKSFLYRINNQIKDDFEDVKKCWGRV